MEGLFTQKQAARLLQLSPRTLERFRVSGRGPAFLKLGYSIRYHAEDLNHWLKRQRCLSTSQEAALENVQRFASRGQQS